MQHLQFAETKFGFRQPGAVVKKTIVYILMDKNSDALRLRMPVRKSLGS